MVVAILFGLVAKLAALQRADMIAELAERVAHRETQEAAAAVRQLASMPRPPVGILVAAATSADRDVAEEAQQAIGRLLRRWQRNVEAERQVGAVAQQLTTLAEALAKHQPMFSRADYPWVTGTTRRVLRLSNRIPQQHAPLVAVHCDAILAAVAPSTPASTQLAEHVSTVGEPVGAESVIGDDGQEMRQARLQREFPAVSAPPLEPALVSDYTPVSEPIANDSPMDPSPEAMLKSPWRASWSHPMFRMVPAMPIDAAPESNDSPAVEPAPPQPDTSPSDADRPLAGLDSRELLHRWLDAEGADVYPLDQELTRRGFGRLSERLVRPVFSHASEDRLRLVDAVLTEPGVDARPWLMMLADDVDADVRWLAVTIMATSNDAVLVEKAWQVAIRDHDPRVAGLAGRLRERREGVLRR